MTRGEQPAATQEETKQCQRVAGPPPKLMWSQERRSIRTTFTGAKLAMVVTIYDEGADEFNQTVRALQNNILELHSKVLLGRGGHRWDEIVVVFVVDGHDKMDPGLVAAANNAGFMDANKVARVVQRRGVLVTSSESVQTISGERDTPSFVGMQSIMCIKATNAGKVDSHEWFFRAYCPLWNVERSDLKCVLVDVGTSPHRLAIYNLVEHLENRVHVGGACGEIMVDLRRIANARAKAKHDKRHKFSLWSNWLILAQVFEYVVANIMDKAMESMFGYITVLPGAFCIYRYRALISGGETTPLDHYFASLSTDRSASIAPAELNMRLAEDRIICWHVVATKGCQWTLSFVSDARAYTDIPLEFGKLLKQRRRWLNGSLFAQLHALENFLDLFTQTNHSYIRKATFIVQGLFLLISTIVQLLSPALFYIAFKLILGTTLSESYAGPFVEFLSTLIEFLSLAVMVLSLVGRYYPLRHAVKFTAYAFGALMMFATAVALVHLEQKSSQLVVYFTIASLGSSLLCAWLHRRLTLVLMSIIPYYALLGAFLYVFVIWSTANLHDVTWGNRPNDAPKANAAQRAADTGGAGGANPELDDPYGDEDDVPAVRMKPPAEPEEEPAKPPVTPIERLDKFRAIMVCAWVAANILFTVVVEHVVLVYYHSVYTTAFGSMIGGLLGMRIIGSLAYAAKRWVIWRLCPRASCCARSGQYQEIQQQLPAQTHTVGYGAIAPV